jgi:glycosyltransferase 2 family protein
LSWAKFLIGWPLSIISIVFIVKYVSSQSANLNISLSNINYIFLGVGILCFFTYYLMRGYLWRFLLSQSGKKISFAQNTYRFAFSELKRFTPGNIWSFLSRSSLFTEVGFDKKTVGISLIADIELVVIGCGLVSILAIPFILSSSQELQSRLSSLLPLSIILVIIYFIAVGMIFKKRYDKSAGILSSVFLPGFKLDYKLKSVILAVITYFIYGLGNYFVLISIVNVGAGQLIPLSAFFVFALLVGYLTFITPMGLGIRELVISLGLSAIMTSADAGAVSIFTRIILIISELSFLGIVFLWQKTAKK